MSKVLKEMVTDVLRGRYDGVEEACVVDITALNVAQTQDVRRKLIEKSISCRVVKNSLARRAFAEGPLKPLGSRLAGPCALLTGGDSIVEVAKTVASLARLYPKIVLKDGLLKGELETISVEDMSRMKSRLELLGDIAGLVSGPGRALAGAMSSPQGKIAGCLKAMADKE